MRLKWSLFHEKEICVRSLLAVTAPLSLTTSSVVLFCCSGGPTEWSILGDIVHDTIPGPRIGLQRLGLEEISGNRRWLSLGNAVLETGVAQICHEGFSITVADDDSCLEAPRLSCLDQSDQFGAVWDEILDHASDKIHQSCSDIEIKAEPFAKII